MCVHVYLSREGLEIFGVVSAIHSFPEAMKPAFVSSGVILAEDVLNIRSVKPSAEVITENETRVYGYFRNFIHQCDTGRKWNQLMFVLFSHTMT